MICELYGELDTWGPTGVGAPTLDVGVLAPRNELMGGSV